MVSSSEEEEVPSPQRRKLRSRAVKRKKQTRADSDDDASVSSNDADTEPSPALKRRKRQKKPVKPGKAKAKQPKISKRKGRKSGSVRKQEDDEDDDKKNNEEESDFDPSNDDDSKEEERKPRSKSRGGRPPKRIKNMSGRGKVEERTCPHCIKVVSTKLALKYHLDNYVCRIEECPDSSLVERAKRKRGKGKKSGVDSYGKRFRGSELDRTCPNCKRVFTSSLGLNYHVKHKVCYQNANKANDVKLPPFHNLRPGARFVTPFGVAEVVKDNRETPSTQPLPSNIKNMSRSWQSAKAKYEQQMSRVFLSKAMHLRARRTKVNALFETQTHNLGKAPMFRAYFGGDPKYMKNQRTNNYEAKELASDPTAPTESFPDRIVECILVPDTRQRYRGSNYKTPTNILQGGPEDDPPSLPKQQHPTKLFLKRRLLTELYSEECATYACLDCGQRFTSVSGQRYHVNGNVCKQKNIAAGEARREREEKLEQGTKDVLEGKTVPIHAPPRAKQPRDARVRKRVRKMKEMGMYPEVLLSLGFELVKEDMKFTDSMGLPEPIEDNELLEYEDEVPVQEALLVHLKKRLEEEQRGADDQKYGSMYAQVFKALGYKKPSQKREASSLNDNNIGTSKRRRRATKMKPAPPPKPLPPIIDTRALADEVDSGRYPSMNRYKGDEHYDNCFICRDGGDLVCCDFCRKAEHMKCIRKKFTVKDPEPEDDFMCHRCIQYVLQRRARAEKRRLEKQERDEVRNRQEALEESCRNPDIKKGKEYEYLAARGQDASELVELLQDAQVRLKQSLATMKMNNVRRRVMGCLNAEK